MIGCDTLFWYGCHEHPFLAIHYRYSETHESCIHPAWSALTAILALPPLRPVDSPHARRGRPAAPSQASVGRRRSARPQGPQLSPTHLNAGCVHNQAACQLTPTHTIDKPTYSRFKLSIHTAPSVCMLGCAIRCCTLRAPCCLIHTDLVHEFSRQPSAICLALLMHPPLA